MKPRIAQIIALIGIAIAAGVGYFWGKNSVPVLGPGDIVFAVSPPDYRLSWVQNNSTATITNIRCSESNGWWRITFKTLE
jgi:hypothetical protein